jgi:hypothetical protein
VWQLHRRDIRSYGIMHDAQRGLVARYRRFGTAYRSEDRNYTVTVVRNQGFSLLMRVEDNTIAGLPTAASSAFSVLVISYAECHFENLFSHFNCCKQFAGCINKPDILLIQLITHLPCYVLPTRPPVGLHFIQVKEGNKLSCLRPKSPCFRSLHQHCSMPLTEQVFNYEARLTAVLTGHRVG